LHEESAVAGIGNVGAGLTRLDSRGDARRRTLLVVTSREVVSETLALAIEAEFPWIAVEQVESVEAACISFARPVSLILIDAFLLDEAEAAATELIRFHPEAHAAVIEANGQRPHAPIVEILKSRLVGGVLPMNLPLDVWLSIVRLMLRGGKYFPADMLYPGIRPGPGDIPRKAGSGDWTEPSRRELEILELVSRGLQNKSIAARLNLSEHTVKIHLHNIISKLRVHNRTEAAAWFRDHGHEVLPKASCETR
jgi:DNA-binding NarL/FixJ family response regulator